MGKIELIFYIPFLSDSILFPLLKLLSGTASNIDILLEFCLFGFVNVIVGRVIIIIRNILDNLLSCDILDLNSDDLKNGMF